jgi:hypothetical protein
MRTQILLASAALAALGAFTASAQVYSVNAVGYVNVTVPASGFALIANQLNATGGNAVSNVVSGVPDGTLVYLWTGTSFSISTFDFGEWDNGGQVLGPGGSAFVRNPTGTALNLTFVGEVPQGTLTTPLIAGFNLVSSQVPQAGTLQATLGYTPTEGDLVYRWNAATQGYSISTFDFGAWDPSEPNIAVGEGFWVRRSSAGSWSRTFSVNQ